MTGYIVESSIVKSRQPIGDPQGGNPKHRRVLVFNVEESDLFWGIGISSSYDPTNPCHVKLPANHKTGLTSDCAAICDDWFMEFELAEFERIGHCPKKEMTQIVEIIHRLYLTTEDE